MKEYTDLTFELFNYCNGSCPGCMLNAIERQFFELSSPMGSILKGLEEISHYGKSVGLNYRVVFSFGDVPKLNWENQKEIYQKVLDLGMTFGITLTCVDRDFNYVAIIDEVSKMSKDIVFDITVDPFRLTNPLFKVKYLENLKYAASQAPHLHLQTLLSTLMMKHFTPQTLIEMFSEIGPYPVFMGFSPTIENMTTKDRYGYELNTAFEYAQSFYNTTERQKSFLKDELRRFSSEGDYEYFLRQTFHIDSALNVYPVSYSIYGDIIQDKRNNIKAFGNLNKNTLSEVLKVKNNFNIAKLNINNNLELDNSPFGCTSCKFKEACKFQGIGLIRKVYKAFEQRAGHCYGPIHLEAQNGA